MPKPNNRLFVRGETPVGITETKRLHLDSNKAHFHNGKDIPEVEHYYRCERCGQAVDMRLPGDVIYHDQEDHKPLRVN